MKAPYKTKMALGLAKIVPMALYGCETCPINESAMKELMSSMADLTTYTTARRSIELAFDVAANEDKDPDPDVEASCRRVMAFRRHATKENETGKLCRMNMQDYCDMRAKGISGEQGLLEDKVLGGQPTSKRRMELRKQCRSEGPVGLLIETAHLNAATIDEKGRMWQHKQPTIDILEEASQDLKKLTRENFARNRTAAAEGCRKEHEGLHEVDKHATKGEVAKWSDEERLLLNTIRT